MIKTITSIVKQYEYDENGRVIKETQTIIESDESEESKNQSQKP